MFGNVAFNRQSIHPLGFTGTSYGIPGFSLNEIRPQSIVDLFQVGTPSVSGPQYTYPRAIEPTSDAIEANTVRHRVTPHTIYAPSGDQASDQSKRIHQEKPLHTIDGLLFTEANPQVPKPTVSNQFRSIGPVPTHSTPGWSSRFGTAELTLRLQFVRPPSIRAFRSGLPVFLNVPQTISFEEYGGFLSEEIGSHQIAHVPVRRMPSPDGFASSEFGTSSVELKNRAVFPVGIPHRGNPQQGLTTPWGTAMVGTTRWFDFQGFDAAEFGTARVEFRIRTLPVQGWDSFADSQGDPAPKPQDRMRVMRVGPSGRQNIILFVSSIYRETPSGIAPTSDFGTPAVSFYIQHVGARGFRSYRSIRRERFGKPVVSTV